MKNGGRVPCEADAAVNQWGGSIALCCTDTYVIDLLVHRVSIMGHPHWIRRGVIWKVGMTCAPHLHRKKTTGLASK